MNDGITIISAGVCSCANSLPHKRGQRPLQGQTGDCLLAFVSALLTVQRTTEEALFTATMRQTPDFLMTLPRGNMDLFGSQVVLPITTRLVLINVRHLHLKLPIIISPTIIAFTCFC